MLADVLIQSGFASTYGGDYDQAVAYSDEAWQISQTIGNEWGLAFSRSRIGFVHRAQGRLGLGIEVAEDSLRLGQECDLHNPQIFAGAELALNYAYLGMTDQGLKVARMALTAAEDKGPSYRPHVLASFAENHLAGSDLEKADEVIQQARLDPHWESFPVLCLALELVDGRLALARSDFDRARQLGQALLEKVRRYGAGAYLPETLDLLGQALLKLDRAEEARRYLLEGREAAEANGAKGHLWPILAHLSATENEPKEAERVRQEARKIVEFIGENSGSELLRDSFLALPEVRALIEATDGSSDS